MNPQSQSEPQPAKILEAALWLLKKGVSIIPIPFRTKKSAIAWKPFQTRLATREEVQGWFSSGPSNYAIVTGSLSGLVVIDCDSLETAAEIEMKYPTPWVQLTSRGKQFFYRHPGGSIPNKARLNGTA